MNINKFRHLSENGENWTEAFRAAVSALERNGGGILEVSAGVYKTGPIRLASNMTLDVQAGARICFIPDRELYPLIDLEFEGIQGPCRTPCIYARGAENAVLRGDGVIDGCGEYWWRMVRSKTLDRPRPYLVCFDRCTNVKIQNLTLTNSPVWTVHPYRCTKVLIEKLNIVNPPDSPNTDGIDPDSCSDVKIIGCTIDVGDDCIAIKSGTEDTPSRVPCERIIITDCHFLHGHGGIVLGSEMSGGIKNVLVSSCVFYQTDRGVRLKTRRGRGGTVSGLRLDNCQMEDVMCPFVFNMMYFCGKGGKLPVVSDPLPQPVCEGTPRLEDVSISGISIKSCTACAGFFRGLPEMRIRNVSISDVSIEMKEGAPKKPAMLERCTEMSRQGFYLCETDGVRLTDIRFENLNGPAVTQDTGADCSIQNVSSI